MTKFSGAGTQATTGLSNVTRNMKSLGQRTGYPLGLIHIITGATESLRIAICQDTLL